MESILIVSLGTIAGVTAFVIAVLALAKALDAMDEVLDRPIINPDDERKESENGNTKRR